MKILIVTNKKDELWSLIKIQTTVAGASVVTGQQFNNPTATDLIWLPNAASVDNDVFELVDAIDQRKINPQKIVMLAVAGINDEVEPTQLEQRFGSQYSDTILAYQYAVKMIDELELPYTVIRAAKTIVEPTTSVISNEGQPILGTQIGERQLALLVAKAVLTDQYLNQSIGIADN
ncbi:NAD(P)H-binding protein [Paucilactobacillus kaifaensis]|uniref:NAD(P)H-binding protein n=1 Tax=Paucilactobacillus kaifaensis TaxID=2559921 RepID=UPI0010F7B114|nr:NAD(P)H-binding protein [Paucilactobacillus kaifaensis]